jgi:hypothetical protein
MFFNVFQGLQPEAKIKKKEKNDDRNIFSNILNFWGEKQSSPLTPRVEQVLTSFKRRFIEVLLFLQQPKNDQEKLKCLRQVYGKRSELQKSERRKPKRTPKTP